MILPGRRAGAAFCPFSVFVVVVAVNVKFLME